MSRNKNLMLALESAKKALEPPPPRSERRNKSRALVEEYRERDEAATLNTDQQVVDSLLEIDVPKTSSLPEKARLGYPKTSLPESSSPPQNEQSNSDRVSLMSALPDVGGFTKLWHQMTDHLYRHLTPSEQAVHIQLFRLSWGHNNSTCVIGLPGLAKRTGIAKTTVQRAVEGLIDKGLIEKTRTVFGRNTEQGVEYRVVPPPALLKTSSLPKMSSLLEMSTVKETHVKETHTNTEGVRVRSRFSLKECRAFADSLKSEGIQNPGGYATKIHRTGEADELIERFLSSPASTPQVDASRCPDCHGTGWWYPNGPEKGTARCKHEHLAQIPG